jgi:NADPH:quinone reductase-like Zn-dependent oxidoreductase
MKAWQYADIRPGFIQSLCLNDDAKNPPHPESGQVVIEMLAASLNPADYKIAEIWPVLSRILFPRPMTPGLDFCGRVSELPSSGKSSLKPGQLVFGRLDLPGRYGCLGQYALAPLTGVVPLPPGVGIDQAASLGTGAITAYQSIVPYVKKGDRVFVNGGSGGTGIFAIQIAKIMGCTVVVSCSGANAQLCRDLGADDIIDYRSVDLLKDLASRGQVFDLAVDYVGSIFELHRESEHFLKPEGTFVLVAATDHTWGGVANMMKSWLLPGFLGGPKRRWKYVLAKNDLEQMTRLGNWIAEGKLKTVIDSEYAFEDVPKAFERLQTGRTRGKIIVNVSADTRST